MKWQDATPLFAMIVIAICLLAIAILAIMHTDTPDALVVTLATVVGFLFISSSQRGTAPPRDGDKP